MPKVAFITVGETGRKTGGYLYNARVIEGLRGRGIEVDEIVACGAPSWEQRAAARRFGSSFDPAVFDVVVVDALARIVVAQHLDHWRSIRPVVALVHELPSVSGGESEREREHEQPLLRTDQAIAVSGHGRRVLLSRGVTSRRIKVVPPGFDGVEALGPSPVGHEGPVRALCVAQWIPRKGILNLVEAWTLHERPGAVLELVGETDADPDYATRVRAAVKEDLSGSIVVSGCVDDARLRAAYASADLFVLPSSYEGYGIVYAEALANGLPVIACEVGPIPDLVGREAAILVEQDDAEGLCGALDLLLGDSTLRDRMSAAAIRRATGLPRWEDTIARFEAVLRDILRTARVGQM